MINDSSSTSLAVISGAFGYVGKAISMKLAEEGFTLVLLYNKTDEETISREMSLLKGNNHTAHKCDLTNHNEVETLFSKIKNEIGIPKLIVHAAGQKPERKKLYVTDEVSFHNQIEQNVFGSFNFLTCGAKILKEGGDGVLVGITTIGVIKEEATKSLGGYIPAKYAVEGMLTMLHDELSPNVRVYSIAPGFMEDGMNKEIPKAFVEMLKAKNNIEQLASGGAIATLIVELYNKTSEHTNEFLIPIAPEFGLYL